MQKASVDTVKLLQALAHNHLLEIITVSRKQGGMSSDGPLRLKNVGVGVGWRSSRLVRIPAGWNRFSEIQPAEPAETGWNPLILGWESEASAAIRLEFRVQ